MYTFLCRFYFLNYEESAFAPLFFMLLDFDFDFTFFRCGDGSPLACLLSLEAFLFLDCFYFSEV